MLITTIKTGSTLVSSAVPNRNTRKIPLSYTGLFQSRNKRIEVPVKCFYVEVTSHHVLIDAGWSIEVTKDAKKHLGFGLWFASEPVMEESEAAINQLQGKDIEAVLMTHLDCDHVSGLNDFSDIPIYVSKEEYEYSKVKKLRYGDLANGYDYHFIDFQDDTNAPFQKSTDIFGDGSIIAYLTPTHSAGSVIYKINDGDKFALIVGDNGYNEDSWEKGYLPGPLYNANNMKECLAWIYEQSKNPECVGIYCAHDPIVR